MSYDPITDYCPDNYYGGYMDITISVDDGTGALVATSDAPLPATDLRPETTESARPDPRFSPEELRRELERRNPVTSVNRLFPNPAPVGGQVTITPASTTIELISLTGRRVSSWPVSTGTTSTTIDLPQDLVPGVYLLKAGARTERLVVR